MRRSKRSVCVEVFDFAGTFRSYIFLIVTAFPGLLRCFSVPRLGKAVLVCWQRNRFPGVLHGIFDEEN